MKIKFNNVLALVITLMVGGLWASNKWLQMPEYILGQLGMAWGLVVYFHFRKKEGESSPPTP